MILPVFAASGREEERGREGEKEREKNGYKTRSKLYIHSRKTAMENNTMFAHNMSVFKARVQYSIRHAQETGSFADSELTLIPSLYHPTH